MFFDIKSQIKLAQNLTELTLRNMSDAAGLINGPGSTGTRETGSKRKRTGARTRDANKSPLSEMMDPTAWIEQMMANAAAAPAPYQPSLWWPLNPSFLSMLQPAAQAIPNMAIPLGLNPASTGPMGLSPFGANPFAMGKADAPGPLPVFSASSPFTGGDIAELPNMFWWLVEPDRKDRRAASNEEDAEIATWAMVMDPFGLFGDPQTETVEEDEAEEEKKSPDVFNPFHLMFDPFGFFTERESERDSEKSAAEDRGPDRDKGSGRGTESADRYEIPTTFDLFDPFKLMQPQSNEGTTGTGGDSRNHFFGFQPGARHPLMNSGRPTGMFYVAVALPPEIESVNPHLPGWNLAF